MHTAGTWWIFQPKSSEKSTENACVNSSPPALSQTLCTVQYFWIQSSPVLPTAGVELLNLKSISNSLLGQNQAKRKHSATNPGPKKGTDNFLIGEQTSNLDQGMGVFVCGLQPTRIALWASIGRPSSQARVTSVNSSSSLMSPETRARRRGLSSSMGQGMFLTHFVVFDQTSSLDHNNITKLWPLDGSFGQSSVPFFGTQNCWGERDD